MSQTIDHRVVEMRFDNKQFETGVKKTMNTLTRLKEALKLPESSKALEGINKAAKDVRLDGIAAGVEALEKRFSTFGIVGMRVIENITDGLMSKLHSAVNFVTDAIVSGGIKRAMNIENAHFQLQALLKDETKVQAVMADAMESVDGTAYAYDEAAKAASQFAASGIQAGEEMLGALKGITGVAAMTNSSFEDISNIFTTVAGNGRLMGDQLLQLSSRGLNAASTLADYFKEVRGQTGMTEGAIREMVTKGQISFKDFSDAMTWAFGDSAKRANETFTGAMSNMKSALARIGAGFISPLVEQNGELVKLFNALRIKINDVKSSLVFDEQRSAIAGLAEATKMSNEELTDMFNNIKKRGYASGEEFKKLANNEVNASQALVKYINGVSDGSIRASYAISSAIEEFTNGTEVSIHDVRRFVEEGKIDLSMFTSAMEHEFGTEKTLSKQFTDFFLDNIHRLVDAINALDVTKPMKVFYHWVEIIKNLAKGVFSVLSPISKAFVDVFNISPDGVIKMSSAIEEFTSKLRLSETSSKNLHDAMEGIFSVAKLILGVALKLGGAIFSINKPLGALNDGFLGLIGMLGRGLTSIVNWISSSKMLNSILDIIAGAFSAGMSAISRFIRVGADFINQIEKTKGFEKLINSISSAFIRFGDFVSPSINRFVDSVQNASKKILDFGNINANNIVDTISEAFSKLADVLDNLDFSSPGKAFDALKSKIKSFLDLIMSNEGIAVFVTNMKQFGVDLREAFTLDNLLDRVEKVMDVFGKFFNWIKNTFGPAFEDFSVGGAIATSGGLGIIYAMIKASKSFESISKTLSSIPNVLGSVKGVLFAYQKDLQASAIIKIAGAIAILAGALTILSFADTERLLNGAVALSMIAGVLMLGFSKLLDSVNKGREVSNGLYYLAKSLGKTMKSFGTAIKIKAIGSSVKDFAASIAIIVASIVVMGYAWRKDPEAFNAAIKTIGVISVALVAIGALSAIGSKYLDAKNMLFMTASITLIASSIGIIVNALLSIMKMKLPDDYEKKLWILGGVIAGLGLLAAALAGAALLAGGNQLPAMGKTFTSLGVMLVATVLSLKMLFNMKLPDDAVAKLGILGGIFFALGALVVTMAAAANIAGGQGFKAGGTILALSAFLVVVTGSLMVLAIIPTDKLIYGAGALGVILVTLAAALAGAGQITKKDTYKTVLAMAMTVGVITAALAVLTMVSWNKLQKSVISLGSVLLALAANFALLSKVKSKKVLPAILGMIAATLTIATSLYVLSEQPWESLLAAGAAMSATILAFSKSFQIILSQDWSGGSVKKLLAFSAMLIPMAGIAAALYFLANQPWESLVAGATGLSLVLVALTGSLTILSKINVNLKSVGVILAGAASLLLIAKSITMLADYDSDQLLSACLALGSILLELAVVLGICSLIGKIAEAAIVGMAVLDAFIISFAGLLTLMGWLWESEEAKGFLSSGIDILMQIGQSIGNFVSSIITSVVTSITSSMPQIGNDLSAFMTNLQPFIEGSKSISMDTLKGVGNLAGIIISLTVAEVINGFASLFNLSLVDIATELSDFMIALQPFITSSASLSEDSMRACGYLADMVIKLTGAELLAGIANFLGIGGNLTDFADELVAFGPAISEFAEIVKDVNPEAVQGAASAAEIMATVASKLQGHGGFIQDIMGDKSLASFADELVAFGPAISEFAEIVKDVNPEAVQGAASAAEIMATMANKLPGQDGLVQKIFGEKNLSVFGSELMAFAPNIKAFAESVKDVDSTAVEGAASAASIMATVANDLPTADSLWNKMFGGGKKSLSSFGDELVKFGTTIVTYSETVAGVNISNVMASIDAFKELANLSNYVGTVDQKAITNFTKSLKDIPTNGVDAFIKVFSDSNTKVSAAISTFFDNAEKSVDSNISKLESKMIKNGEYVIDGFIKGLNGKKSALAEASSAIGKIVDKSICSVLDIHSPSGVAEERGEQTDQGLANGLKKGANKVKKAASDVGTSLNKSLGSALTNTTSLVTQAFDGSIEGEKRYWANWTGISQQGVTTNEELNQKLVTDEKNTVSKNKEINNESLLIEGEYWKNLLYLKRTGADGEKYQEMTMTQFREDTLKNATEIYNNYVEKFKSTRDSIMNSFNLFTEVSRKEGVGKEQLKKNLEDQIALYNEYANVMNTLNQRIDNEPLIEELRNLGADSVEQLKIINSMTDEELSAYSNLYNQKMAAAGNAAVTQLKGLQTETEKQLSELFGAVNSQINLFDFNSVFNGTIESLDSFISNIFLPMEKASEEAKQQGMAIGENISQGIESGLGDVSDTITDGINSVLEDAGKNTKKDANEVGENITKGVAKGMDDAVSSLEKPSKSIIDTIDDTLKSEAEIHSPSQLTRREVGPMLTEGIAEGMLDAIDEISKSAEKIIDTFIETIKDSKDLISKEINTIMNSIVKDMEDIGANAGKGFVNGMTSHVNKSKESGEELGDAVVDGAKEALDEHSPSRVMGQIARFAGLGFINNIVPFISQAYDNGKEMGGSLAEGVKTSIKILDEIDDPIITPNVDMSNVRKSFKDINRMFNEYVATKNIEVNGISNSIEVGKFQAKDTKTTKVETPVSTHLEFVQNNYSPKALSTAEIYRNTKNQFALAKGMVNGI